MFLVTSESIPIEYLKNGKATGSNVDVVTEALERVGYGLADSIIDVAYNGKRAKNIKL